MEQRLSELRLSNAVVRAHLDRLLIFYKRAFVISERQKCISQVHMGWIKIRARGDGFAKKLGGLTVLFFLYIDHSHAIECIGIIGCDGECLLQMFARLLTFSSRIPSPLELIDGFR